MFPPGRLVCFAWGALLLAGAQGLDCRATASRPNLLLIVVDTLRADHLGCYGHRRPTSPQIDARLAALGAVVEQAYAPAPWTIPSMMALFTGRTPGRLLGTAPLE